MTITTIGLRNKLPGRDDMSSMSDASKTERAAGDKKKATHSWTAKGWHNGAMLMTIPRHTTSSCGTGVSAIFLHWHGLWSGSKHLPQQQQPLSQHITMVGFHFCEQRNSERASFYPHFGHFFLLFLGYHGYHRELGYRLFFYLFPISNLIMAGSWGGYLICIYSMEGPTTGGFWFSGIRRDAAMHPQTPQPRLRPRAETTPLLFSSSFYSLGWIPVGTRVREAGYNNTPFACVSRHIASPSFLSSLLHTNLLVFSCLMDDVLRPLRPAPHTPPPDLIAPDPFDDDDNSPARKETGRRRAHLGWCVSGGWGFNFNRTKACGTRLVGTGSRMMR